MTFVYGTSPVGSQHRLVAPARVSPPTPIPAAHDGAEILRPDATRFANGLFAHRSKKAPDSAIPNLTVPALALFTTGADVPRWVAACVRQWPGFHPLIGPEIEVRDRAHDSSMRGTVHVTPAQRLYEELHEAVPGSTIVTAPSLPQYALAGPSAKLFPGRGRVYRFDGAAYAVHVLGGTDDAMIRISERDRDTGHCRRVDWPLLHRESPFTSRLECCLAGMHQAEEWIAAARGVNHNAVTAAIEPQAVTDMAYVRDAGGKEMALFEYTDGHLTCTNGAIQCAAYPAGRVPLASWETAIDWIEREILSGRVMVNRDTDMTALSVPTDDDDVRFAAGRDAYGIPEYVSLGPIAWSQWSAITRIAAGLQAAGALGGTAEIPTALQAHVALPFQHANGAFTAAPLAAVLRQWRDELPLLEELIPAEPGRYVFIQALHAAIFGALDAADLDDASPRGVAAVYGNLLAAFFVHHGAKYAALNISPICGHVLKRLGAEYEEVREWLRQPHPLLAGKSLADILPALKDQPTIEIRRSDTLVTQTGAFSAWLNETMLRFLFGWTLRAVAQSSARAR